MQVTLIPNLKFEDTVFTHNRGWYSENLIGSDSLVVTVGDSWTWGDDLGQINSQSGVFEDYNYRTKHIYGQLIANVLDADFVNISIPGASNIFVFDKLQLLLEHVQHYKKIYVFVTLTELGREFVNDPVWVDQIEYSTVDELLIKYEHKTLIAFENLFKQYPKVDYLLGRNFTFTYNNNVHLANHLNKTWVELLDQDRTYPKSIRVVTSLAIDALKATLSETSTELVNLIETSISATAWMEDSKYIVRGHPNEKAHQIWADYLLSNL